MFFIMQKSAGTLKKKVIVTWHGWTKQFNENRFVLWFFFQVASKYGMPPEMIKNVYKKTKKG